MRFFLDENISGHTEDFLRQEGHEIFRSALRARDRDVFQAAQAKKAILLTRDRDFLNFLPSPFSGIIYVRIHPSIAEHITSAVENLLAACRPDTLLGRVVILTKTGIEIFR